MRKYNSSHEYYKATKKKARRNGLLWNQDEIDMILEMEYDDMQLSELIGRTVEAIHVKRCRVKGIQDVSV